MFGFGDRHGGPYGGAQILVAFSIAEITISLVLFLLPLEVAQVDEVQE